MDFESNQINWDDDGDGDIDVDDILAAFDTDGDGQIGSSELQKLAEQLSSQVSFPCSCFQHLSLHIIILILIYLQVLSYFSSSFVQLGRL